MRSLNKLFALNRCKAGRRFEVENKADDNEATVYLYDMIVDTEEEAAWWGGVSAEAFVKEMARIKAKTIHVRVNSPGGSVFGGRAMEQAIRQHKSEVIVHVDGLAASAASFLVLPADHIEMAPGSFMMIHKAWAFMGGNADEYIKQAELLNQIDDSLAETYSRKTGIAANDVKLMMASETWLEANTAVAQGFADSVTEDKPRNSIDWDLSAYARAPKIDTFHDEPPKGPDREAMRRDVMRALIPA